MIPLTIKCPHCLKGHNFTPLGDVPLKQRIALDDLNSVDMPSKNKRTCFWVCDYCGKGITGTVEVITSSDTSNKAVGHIIKEIFPKILPSELPEHSPKDVERYFLQGEDNLKLKNYDACIAMMRIALERGIVEFVNLNLKENETPIDQVKNLLAKIEELAGDGLLTKSMADWAHAIRDAGNFTLHKPTPPGDEITAREIMDITKMFLTYAFTMPQKVKELAKHRASHSSAPDNTLPSPEEP